jgi:hypothetical protein
MLLILPYWSDGMEYGDIIITTTTTTTKPFIPKASWGKLEMKPHEKKIGTKQEQKRRGKTKGDKKPN